MSLNPHEAPLIQRNAGEIIILYEQANTYSGHNLPKPHIVTSQYSSLSVSRVARSWLNALKSHATLLVSNDLVTPHQDQLTK